jgi:hypothetical protein
MAGNWRNISVHKCRDADGILRALKRAGLTLPTEISTEVGALMDLAERVAEDDQVWNALPGSYHYNGYTKNGLRRFLRELVADSK